MADTYFTVVTDLGVKKMLEALDRGEKLNITEFAVGDGGGSCHEPTAAAEGLRNEVWRGAVNACHISGESEKRLVVESVIPSDVGGFTIREMGIFDSTGGLVALCNTPATQKAGISDGAVHELNLSMELALANTDSVELIVDPNVVTATKKDVRELQDQINQLSGSVGAADKYNADIPYQTGDYCIYGDVLYKCTKSTTGGWDAGCWQQTSTLGEIADIGKSMRKFFTVATDEDIDRIIDGTYEEKEEGGEAVWTGETISEADIDQIIDNCFNTAN